MAQACCLVRRGTTRGLYAKLIKGACDLVIFSCLRKWINGGFFFSKTFNDNVYCYKVQICNCTLFHVLSIVLKNKVPRPRPQSQPCALTLESKIIKFDFSTG